MCMQASSCHCMTSTPVQVIAFQASSRSSCEVPAHASSVPSLAHAEVMASEDTCQARPSRSPRGLAQQGDSPDACGEAACCWACSSRHAVLHRNFHWTSLHCPGQQVPCSQKLWVLRPWAALAIRGCCSVQVCCWSGRCLLKAPVAVWHRACAMQHVQRLICCCAQGGVMLFAWSAAAAGRTRTRLRPAHQRHWATAWS